MLYRMSVLKSVSRVWRRDQFCFSNYITGVFVTTDSGEAQLPQSVMGVHSRSSIRATRRGSSQRQISIFAAVSPSPSRPSPLSGRLTNGHRAFAECLEMRCQRPPDLRCDAGTDTRRVHELAPDVVPDQD